VKKNILAFILFLSSLAGIVSGQEINAARLEKVLENLKLDKTKIKEEFCTEKKMPNAEDSYIIVIPVLQGKEEEDLFTVQNFILITDENGGIKNKYIDPEEITSDAIMLRGITIDTGLYSISNGIRAFGVKTNFEGSSRPNPYSSEEISMYYPEGKSLKKVLNKFSLYSSSGEWDTNCAGEFEDSHSVIIVDKAKTNSFTDLKIKTISTTTKNRVVNGDCKDSQTSKTGYQVLQFKNGKYQ
jgi:hypothetical protein